MRIVKLLPVALFAVLFAWGRSAAPQCDIRIAVPDSIFGRWSSGIGDDTAGLKITQTFYFRAAPSDSVELKVERTTFIEYLSPPFYFRNLRLTCLSEGEEVSVPFDFDRERLRFRLPRPDCAVTLSYDYSNDYGLSDPKQPLHCTERYLLPYISDWHSWYFTAPGMKLARCEAIVPPGCYFFTDTPCRIEGDRYVLDVAALDGPIDFYLADKRFYTRSYRRFGRISVHIYQTCGAQPNSDTTDYVRGRLPAESARRREKNAGRMIKRLAKLFPRKDSQEIHVMDADLVRGTVMWGNTTRMDAGRYLVLIDTSMWHNSGLCHELVHVFDRGVLGSLPPTDSMRYFFAESLPEYLAVRVAYPRRRVRDKVFRNYALAYMSSPGGYGSIVGLSDNSIDGSDRSGSSTVIYLKAPYVLHCFAEEVGRRKFMKIFRNFYGEAVGGGDAGWAGLERAARAEGVTDARLKILTDNLRPRCGLSVRGREGCAEHGVAADGTVLACLSLARISPCTPFARLSLHSASRSG